MNSYTKSTAIFSPCRTWRYTLERWWAEGQYVNFLMLNPSTADEVQPDRTVTRCIDFARAWSYAGLVVTNIFALRSTDPEALLHHSDPVGPDNDVRILRTALSAGLVIAAWGTWGKVDRRGEQVAAILKGNGIKFHCLGKTKDGYPKHPLYLKATTKPQPF